MKYSIIILTILFLLFEKGLLAQTETYIINKTSFSTDNYDEFAPVWYKKGLVFCSNRDRNPFLNYSDSFNRGKINMYYIDTIPGLNWRKAIDFAEEIRTKLNDGPLTVSLSGDTIYYSRNQIVDGKANSLSKARNKLGLYSAVYDGSQWTKVMGLRFNNEWYNISTPNLSHDGKILFFASDMPDGYGGIDLYYSQWRDGYWEDPINLGSTINTEGNESYPYLNKAGEFFFVSDGHPGMGKKDIFVTKRIGDDWYPPINLDAPINSQFDDFGFINDPLLNEGYFSSSRGKTSDIYRFTSSRFPVWFCEEQKVNRYCYLFSDSGSIELDSSRFYNQWSFGENERKAGRSVSYCFPGPGVYDIRLDIMDRASGNQFFNKIQYRVELIDNIQPFINSEDFVLVGEILDIDGLQSLYPGYRALDYYWEFSDSVYAYGERISHVFTSPGEYEIRLGLVLEEEDEKNIVKRSVFKRIFVFENLHDKEAHISDMPATDTAWLNILNSDNVNVTPIFFADEDLLKEAVFRIEILKSPEKLDMQDKLFSRVRPVYEIEELVNPEDSSYSYVIGKKINLSDTYLEYSEIVQSGFSEAKIRMTLITDPAERELLQHIRRFGLSSDTYFGTGDRLITNAFLMLNQVVLLLNKYPDVKLEIGVHTDNLGSSDSNLALSKKRAQQLVDYLRNAGISSNRLISRGYGEAYPVATNFLEKDRKKNRRIEFTLIK